MATLAELLAEHTGLPGAAVDHLQLVVAEWQLLSDLGFADFLMWIPLDEKLQRFLCVAQVRPTTSPTGHLDDMVGAELSAGAHPQLRRALLEDRVCREEDPRWHHGVPVR